MHLLKRTAEPDQCRSKLAEALLLVSDPLLLHLLHCLTKMNLVPNASYKCVSTLKPVMHDFSQSSLAP